MAQIDLDLLNYYRYYRNWWLLVLFILAGGAAGWIFHRVQPPLYDAQASITVTVDYSQTGNISAYNLDLAVGAIKGVFYSSSVIQPLIQLAEVPSAQMFRVFKLERFGDTWILSVRRSDPQEAAMLANVWVEAGYQVLVDAHAHAQRARILSRYLTNLASCPPPPAFDPAMPAICLGSYRMDPAAMQKIQNQFQQELIQSKSINAFLLFSLNSPAQPPSEPVMFVRSWLLLAGMLTGFISGIVILGVLPSGKAGK